MKLNFNHALLPLLAVFFTALVATGGLVSLNDDSSGNELTGDVSGYQIFQKPSAKPLPRICAQVMTYACEDRKPTNCREFSSSCLPSGWSKKPKVSKPQPEPTITVAPVPEPTKIPTIGVPKLNPRLCLLQVVRPCAPGKKVDVFGCSPCSKKVVR